MKIHLLVVILCTLWGSVRSQTCPLSPAGCRVDQIAFAIFDQTRVICACPLGTVSLSSGPTGACSPLNCSQTPNSHPATFNGVDMCRCATGYSIEIDNGALVCVLTGDLQPYDPDYDYSDDPDEPDNPKCSCVCKIGYTWNPTTRKCHKNDCCCSSSGQVTNATCEDQIAFDESTGLQIGELDYVPGNETTECSPCDCAPGYVEACPANSKNWVCLPVRPPPCPPPGCIPTCDIKYGEILVQNGGSGICVCALGWKWDSYQNRCVFIGCSKCKDAILNPGPHPPLCICKPGTDIVISPDGKQFICVPKETCYNQTIITNNCTLCGFNQTTCFNTTIIRNNTVYINNTVYVNVTDCSKCNLTLNNQTCCPVNYTLSEFKIGCTPQPNCSVCNDFDVFQLLNQTLTDVIEAQQLWFQLFRTFASDVDELLFFHFIDPLDQCIGLEIRLTSESIDNAWTMDFNQADYLATVFYLDSDVRCSATADGDIVCNGPSASHQVCVPVNCTNPPPPPPCPQLNCTSCFANTTTPCPFGQTLSSKFSNATCVNVTSFCPKPPSLNCSLCNTTSSCNCSTPLNTTACPFGKTLSSLLPNATCVPVANCTAFAPCKNQTVCAPGFTLSSGFPNATCIRCNATVPCANNTCCPFNYTLSAPPVQPCIPKPGCEKCEDDDVEVILRSTASMVVDSQTVFLLFFNSYTTTILDLQLAGLLVLQGCVDVNISTTQTGFMATTTFDGSSVSCVTDEQRTIVCDGKRNVTQPVCIPIPPCPRCNTTTITNSTCPPQNVTTPCPACNQTQSRCNASCPEGTVLKFTDPFKINFTCLNASSLCNTTSSPLVPCNASCPEGFVLKYTDPLKINFTCVNASSLCSNGTCPSCPLCPPQNCSSNANVTCANSTLSCPSVVNFTCPAFANTTTNVSIPCSCANTTTPLPCVNQTIVIPCENTTACCPEGFVLKYTNPEKTNFTCLNVTSLLTPNCTACANNTSPTPCCGVNETLVFLPNEPCVAKPNCKVCKDTHVEIVLRASASAIVDAQNIFALFFNQFATDILDLQLTGILTLANCTEGEIVGGTPTSYVGVTTFDGSSITCQTDPLRNILCYGQTNQTGRFACVPLPSCNSTSSPPCVTQNVTAQCPASNSTLNITVPCQCENRTVIIQNVTVVNCTTPFNNSCPTCQSCQTQNFTFECPGGNATNVTVPVQCINTTTPCVNQTQIVYVNNCTACSNQTQPCANNITASCPEGYVLRYLDPFKVNFTCELCNSTSSCVTQNVSVLCPPGANFTNITFPCQCENRTVIVQNITVVNASCPICPSVNATLNCSLCANVTANVTCPICPQVNVTNNCTATNITCPICNNNTTRPCDVFNVTTECPASNFTSNITVPCSCENRTTIIYRDITNCSTCANQTALNCTQPVPCANVTDLCPTQVNFTCPASNFSSNVTFFCPNSTVTSSCNCTNQPALPCNTSAACPEGYVLRYLDSLKVNFTCELCNSSSSCANVSTPCVTQNITVVCPPSSNFTNVTAPCSCANTTCPLCPSANTTCANATTPVCPKCNISCPINYTLAYTDDTKTNLTCVPVPECNTTNSGNLNCSACPPVFVNQTCNCTSTFNCSTCPLPSNCTTSFNCSTCPLPPLNCSASCPFNATLCPYCNTTANCTTPPLTPFNCSSCPFNASSCANASLPLNCTDCALRCNLNSTCSNSTTPSNCTRQCNPYLCKCFELKHAFEVKKCCPPHKRCDRDDCGGGGDYDQPGGAWDTSDDEDNYEVFDGNPYYSRNPSDVSEFGYTTTSRTLTTASSKQSIVDSDDNDEYGFGEWLNPNPT